MRTGSGGRKDSATSRNLESASLVAAELPAPLCSSSRSMSSFGRVMACRGVYFYRAAPPITFKGLVRVVKR
jgi:hypothetical protein